MKLGIIGYGTMGRIRHDSIKKIPGYTVTKVFEPDNKKFIYDAERVRDYKGILKDKNIRGIFVCVPNYLILRYVTEALDHGKHIFCEKPPGTNSAQVLKMIKAEQRNPRLKLMFGFNHRHHESIIHAKELINSGKYGKLLWLRGRYGKSVNPDFVNNWRSQKKFSGGGIFLDQGIHMLDLFLMMCGNFDQVKAFVSNLYWKSDIEDNVFAILKNNQGQVASLHSTMTQWRHLFALEMFLEHGYITINGLLTTSGAYGQEQMTIAKNRSKSPSATWNKEVNLVYTVNSSWDTEVKIFLKSIQDNTKIPMGNTEDALKLMKIVDKIYAQK